MRHRCVWLAVAASFATLAVAQQLTPPSKAELDAVTRRGRMLAEYDQAAWHSTDAVMALKLDMSKLSFYAAKKTETGWMAVWGRLSDQQDKALILYEAHQSDSPTAFTVTTHDPPLEDTGFFLVAARAIPHAMNDFQGQQRPYNVAVIPTESDGVYVYIQPAQTKVGVYPLGGDVRYRFSADGLNILEKRQLHKTIIEFTSDPKVQTMGGYHTHVLSDVPEDTDVFHVLRKERPVPEYVSSNKFTYIIQPDGSIQLVGDTDKFLKTRK